MGTDPRFKPGDHVLVQGATRDKRPLTGVIQDPDPEYADLGYYLVQLDRPEEILLSEELSTIRWHQDNLEPC